MLFDGIRWNNGDTVAYTVGATFDWGHLAFQAADPRDFAMHALTGPHLGALYAVTPVTLLLRAGPFSRRVQLPAPVKAGDLLRPTVAFFESELTKIDRAQLRPNNFCSYWAGHDTRACVTFGNLLGDHVFFSGFGDLTTEPRVVQPLFADSD